MTPFTRNHNVIFVVYSTCVVVVFLLGILSFGTWEGAAAAVIVGWLGGWTANDLYRYLTGDRGVTA